MRRSIPLAGLVVALMFMVLSGTAAAVEVGEKAPSFSLKDETGRTHSLSDYKGKVVVLEWTNPQCPFVKRHYREQTMTRTARRFDGKVVWLAVNSSHFNRPEQSRAWRERKKLPFPTLQDRTGGLGKAFGARATPHMFVIDGEGIVRYAGAIDDDPHDENKRPRNYVAAALSRVLSGRKPDPASTRPYGCSVKYKPKR